MTPEESKHVLNMFGWLAAVAIAFFIIGVMAHGSAENPTSVSNPTVPAITPAPTQKWWEGGTLTHATTKEWREADFHNRLATAGDIALVWKYRKDGDDYVNKNTGAKLTSLDSVEDPAMEMEQCISEEANSSDGSAGDQEVALVAAMCSVLMDHQNPTKRLH